MAMAVMIRGRIVERTARQLVVAFAHLSISVDRSIRYIYDLSRVLSRSCNIENQVTRNLDKSDLLVRFVRGISPSVSSYRSRRVASAKKSRVLQEADPMQPAGNRSVDRVVSAAPDEIRVHEDLRHIFLAWRATVSISVGSMAVRKNADTLYTNASTYFKWEYVSMCLYQIRNLTIKVIGRSTHEQVIRSNFKNYIIKISRE